MLEPNTKTYKVLAKIKNSVPESLRLRLDAEKFGVLELIKFASNNINESARVLDAGAGPCPYKKHFSHTCYESTDVIEKNKHDFYCRLDDIPQPDNSYDAILNTQVLEHVEYPQKVIDEFYRILKPGGKLFLTAPGQWQVHEAPNHYYNFTPYGLGSLFKDAGFKIKFIKPRGGVYWFLGKTTKALPRYLLEPYLFEETEGVKKFKLTPQGILLSPFILLALPFTGFLIPLTCFYLDGLDKRKDNTLGYACYCVKE
ncbi:methyltransferase domain-containing protein [Patescibacteria group bacterium]|nr:methyltransferase domain-containing protein [Patescibacteria group bacterium]MBU1673021.1 methyltransferase domain-containing protein [Patescibacteria group bacterium]MBU1963290.1 methyltransferase domain-containing protein [Patescibacteria group bacterium]